MSIAKRIIPCLDVKDGITVKGTCFVSLREAGDPVELGKAYSQAGADELVFLDITASHEGRKTFTDIVSRVAEEVNIPFTVGGGIGELSDVERLLNAGADKVSINSAALRRPQLINEIARRYGSQVCVCAIDARFVESGAGGDGSWECYLNGGRLPTGRDLFEWAHEVQVPIIASGGAGTMEHFRDAFALGHADAALAASVFHFGEIPIPTLKRYLQSEGINVRI